MLTFFIIKSVGVEAEQNPLMRKLIEEIGDNFLYPKIMMGTLVGFLIVIFWDKYKWFKLSAIGILCLYFCIVVAHVIGIKGM